MGFLSAWRVRNAVAQVEKGWNGAEPDLTPLRALATKEQARAYLALAERRLDTLDDAEKVAEVQRRAEAHTREHGVSPALRAHVRKKGRKRAPGEGTSRNSSNAGDPTSTPVRAAPCENRPAPPPELTPLIHWSRTFLDEALRLAPDLWDALAARAVLESGPWGRREAALVAYAQLHAIDHRNQRVRAELCILLLQEGRVAEARTHFAFLGDLDHLEQGLRLGEALFGAGCSEEALEWLTNLEHAYERELKNSFDTEGRKVVVSQYEVLQRLKDELAAEVHGREASVLLAAAEGKLDARAGVNYTLLGEALLLESDFAPDSLALRSAEEEETRGKQLERTARKALGQGLRGAAALRQGKPGVAERWFRRAIEEDGRFWPAFLGLGSAMMAQQHRAAASVAALPDLPLPPDLPRVLPGWPALSSLERRVVLASVHPLRRFLPSLAALGCRIVILPFDAKATTLPELRELADPANTRTDDHRHYEAIGGLAKETMAVTRVLDLLHVEGPLAWILAHELAHIVFENHHEALDGHVQALYKRACGVGYLMDFYGAKNEHEFLAVTYTDYLRHRYGLEREKELDEQGVMAAIFDWYDGLGDA